MTIDEVSVPGMPKVGSLEEHARLLGWICIRWGHLENLLRSYLMFLGEPPNFTGRIDHGSLVTAILARLEVLPEWMRPQTESALHQIGASEDRSDNNLRNRRNRVIHDTWWAIEEPVRTEFIRKSFKETEVHPMETANETVPVADIQSLHDDIERVNQDLLGLWGQWQLAGALQRAREAGEI